MAFEILGDPGFHRELAALDERLQDVVRASLKALQANPLKHPQLVRLHGSRYPGSFRLRIGPHRVLGIVLAGPGLVFLTTVFTKKRESDYDQALQRHDQRMAAQGPPLDEFLRSARRRP